MSTKNNPKSIFDDFLDTPTIEQLRTCGYEEALAKNEDKDVNFIHEVLVQASSIAHESGQEDSANALLFLARLCSMTLCPSDLTNPFHPLAGNLSSWHSVVPDKLTTVEVELMALFAPEVENPMLKARLGDLVWLRGRTDRFKFAAMAIDGYKQHPIENDTWLFGGECCWHRALQLSISLKGKNGELAAEIDDRLLNAFWDATKTEDPDAFNILQPLYAERRCASHAESIADYFLTTGLSQAAIGRIREATVFFDFAERWYGRSNNPEKKADSIALMAASYESQGDANKFVAARHHFYSKAISVYRGVETKYRTKHSVEERIGNLRKKLIDAGSQTVASMTKVPGQEVELAAWTREAIMSVQGKSLGEALIAFCSLHPLPDQLQILTESKSILTDSVFGTLFGSISLSADGRTVDKRESADSSDQAFETESNSRAVETCLLITGMTSHAIIVPALEIIRTECSCLTQQDFSDIALESPVVPRERVDLVARGLYAGYCLDFVQAIHILMPQFEHIVRMALKDVGCLTTTHGLDGTDMEVGLSTLIDRPEMLEVFGDNFTFTVRAIMCDQNGPNLRNTVAHGLADNKLCTGLHSIYAWWFILRLVTKSAIAATLPIYSRSKSRI